MKDAKALSRSSGRHWISFSLAGWKEILIKEAIVSQAARLTLNSTNPAQSLGRECANTMGVRKKIPMLLEGYTRKNRVSLIITTN